MEARSVDVGHGWSWFTCGFRLFARSPGRWMLVSAVVFVLVYVLSRIPVLGGLAFAFLWPVMTAGLLHAAHAADAQRAIDVGNLFYAWRDTTKRNRLLWLGAVALAVSIATAVVMVMVFSATHNRPLAIEGGIEALNAMGPPVLLAMLIVFSVQLVATMALIYAIPLVMFRDIGVNDAIRSSFRACMRNALPLLVFGAVYTVAAVVASLPLLLGWLVLLPASVGMLYCSYKDLYDNLSA